MRIKSDYKLRDIAGETIMVNQGKAGADMTKVISLNSSARLLYEELSGKEFEMSDVVKVLVDSYEIDQEKAQVGAQTWVESMRECGVIE